MNATTASRPGTGDPGPDTTSPPPEGPPETLRGARSVIPAHCYSRPAARAAWTIVRAVAVYAAVVALLVVTDAVWLLVPLWALSGLALSSLFILAHDAAHGALFGNDRLNATLGRILMLPHLHVYSGWVVGHNRLHHGHTVRETADFVWHPATVDEYRDLSPLGRLRHRIEWGPLGAGLYYTRVVWWQKMMTTNAPAKHRAKVRADLALVVAYALATTALAVTLGALAGGSLTAGLWMALKVLVIPWAVFMFIIGWTVYVHHIAADIKWWPRPTWNGFHGQVEGTTILHVVPPLNVFFLNIFVHVPHHVDARIPFHALPDAADAIVDAYGDAVTEKPLRIRDYVHNVRRCKLYDFDDQTWLPYSAAR